MPDETVAERIDRIVRECNFPGWDSYGAEPVSPLAATMAKLVATGIGPHFVGPTNEGGFEFEWDADNGTYLVRVTYIPNGR